MVQTWAPNRQVLSLEGPSQKTCQIPYTSNLHEIDCSICSADVSYKCFAHELWPCASKWIELCKPSVHYLLWKSPLLLAKKDVKHPPNKLCPTLVSLVFLHNFFGLAHYPYDSDKKGDYLWGDSQPKLKTKDGVVTSLTKARVNQHQPVHHPLDASYDSLMDDPHLSYYPISSW
jgi:hypothetical protein